MRTAKAEWEAQSGKKVCDTTFKAFWHHYPFKNAGGKYKRIRHRPKGQPLPEHYALQVEKLQELEKMSVEGRIELYYGDETHVCSEGYVPYGWQFPDEEVCFLSENLTSSTVLV